MHAQLLLLTGLTRPQIDAVIEHLRSRTRIRCPRGRPWAASLRRRVVVACASPRTNLTMRELAAVFGMSKSQVHRIVAELASRLAARFEAGARGDRRRTWILDGALVPTRDHRGAAKSKNCRWSCNVQVLVRHADRRIFVAGGGPGNRNDPVHYRGSLVQTLCRQHRRVLADGGYRGIEELITPVFRGRRIVRDRALATPPQAAGARRACDRSTQETGASYDHRRRACNVLITVKAVAFLYNLTIELRDIP